MSADAKVWQDHKGYWYGLHDGDESCRNLHEGTAYDLAVVLAGIEACMSTRLDWEIRQYNNGFGLDGRQARSGR